MNTNYKDLLSSTGLTHCSHDKNDCINEIISLNCTNMEKLADKYSSQIKKK